MKLVHVLDNLNRGGAQTMLRSMVAGLSARGYDQHIICLSEVFNTQVVEAMRQAGATVEIIGRPRLFGGIGLWQLLQTLRRHAPDVVHTELPWGDLLGRTAARVLGLRPIVSTITARYADKPRLQLLCDRITARWIDKAAFQSREIVAFSVAFEGILPDQVVIIPNGVDADDRDRSAAASHLRQAHGRGARTVLGMVARLHPQKAHGDLLAAIAKLARSDVCLWLIGDGPERARLEAQAERLGITDRVAFVGDRDDVPDWIAAMDVFVHPTYFEGLPLAVLEAMAAGKPVVATAVDGLLELITHAEHAWLVPPGDPEALAAAIADSLADPTRTAAIARAGAARVRSSFSAERVVEAYDSLFRSVMATPSGRPAIALR